MKHSMSIALAVVLVGSPGIGLAAAGPHCAVNPNQIAKLGQGRGNPAVSGETLLPKPVLPAANVGRAALSAATIAATAARAAASVAPPAVLPVSAATAAKSSSLSASPSSIAPRGRVAETNGPANWPLKPISSARIAALPALTRIASKGAKLYALGASHGMQGVFARNGNYFQVFYITPDGKAAIAGIMWNAAGRNLTLRQVRHVPGLKPTVRLGAVAHLPIAHHVAYRIGSGATAPKPLETLPAGSLFQALAISDHGTVGKPSAPRVWMFMDPLCSYSIAAMRQLMPVVTADKLRVSVVPLSVLDYEDHGMSTKEAKVMLSQSPASMAKDWIDKGLAGEQARASAGEKLAFNMELARAVRLKGTPTFFWRTRSGGIGRSNGLPADLPAVIASIRSPS
ncbi:MAG: hypothetical protein PHT60_14830 [Acidiphilium sp.]|nr:hypothetical protein [Acidiphilium sp.]MDD4937036.1 hypothetical protein [Acidiphilium sp.]